MHIEEAIANLEKVKEYEEFSKQVIKHMNYTLNYAPESLIQDYETNKISLDDRKMHIKRALIETLTDHYNIYEGIKSINTWIDTDFPKTKYKNTKDFIKKLNYKFYGYSTGLIGLGFGGYELFSKGIETIPAIVLASSFYILGQSVRMTKNENSKRTILAKKYYEDISEYCKIETEAENNLRIFENSVKLYRDNINYLHSQIILPKKIEYDLDNMIIDLTEVSGKVKVIAKSISQEKVKSSGFYEVKIPKLLWYNLINRNYFGKIQRDNKKKAKNEITGVLVDYKDRNENR
jgi:hypothetical protein